MSDERDGGAIAIVVALFAVVAFGFAAIIVDLGYARMVKAQIQDAADSAALLAAQALVDGATPSQAAVAGKGNVDEILDLAITDLSLVWDCVGTAPSSEPRYCASFDDATNPRRVRVLISGIPVSSFFGGVFGYGDSSVAASAVASLGPVTFTPACAICVLSGDEQAIDGDVTATRADISFAGDVLLGPGGSVLAQGRTVFLGGRPTGSVANFDDALITNAGPIVNPLPSTPPDDPPDVPLVDDDPLNPPPPVPGPPRVDPCNSDPGIGGPGVYGAFTLGSSPLGLSCVLEEGTYIFNGPVTAATDAVISGTDVKIWARDNIDLSRAATVTLDSEDDVSAIYASPADAVTIRPFSRAIFELEGHINAQGATLVGGPCGNSSVDGLIVVSRIAVGTDQCIESTAPTNRVVEDTEPPVLIR